MPNLKNYTQVSFDINTIGDNTIIAAVAGKDVHIYRIWIRSNGINTITIKNSAGTAFGGAMNMNPGDAFGLADDAEPIFETSPGNGLLVNLSAAQHLVGVVDYLQD